MKVYLLRHGQAGPKEQGTPDEARALTPEGRQCTLAMIRLLRHACRPVLIASSPLLRARETAVIARRALRIHEPLVHLESLRPGVPPAATARWLKAQRRNAIMLVGHMPDLAILAAYMTHGIEQEGTAIRKSGIACIDFNGKVGRGSGTMDWLVFPALLGVRPGINMQT